MAPHSSTLAWKIPWMEEPGRLLLVHGIAKNRTRLRGFTFTFHFHPLEKEMATRSSVLAWRIPWTEKPGRLQSMGSHRVGHDWNDLAAAAARGREIRWRRFNTWYQGCSYGYYINQSRSSLRVLLKLFIVLIASGLAPHFFVSFTSTSHSHPCSL